MKNSYERNFFEEFDELINKKPMNNNEWAITISKFHRYDVRKRGKRNPYYDSRFDIYKGYYIDFNEDERFKPAYSPDYVAINDYIKIKMALKLLIEVYKNEKLNAPFRSEIIKNSIISLVALSNEFEIGENELLYNEL